MDERDERLNRLLRAFARRGLLPFPVTDELAAHCYATAVPEGPGRERSGARDETDAPTDEILRRVRAERVRRAGLRVLVPTVVVGREWAESEARASVTGRLVPVVRSRAAPSGELLTSGDELEAYGILPEPLSGAGDGHALLRVPDDGLRPLLLEGELVLVRHGSGLEEARAEGPSGELRRAGGGGLVVERCRRGRAVIRRAELRRAAGEEGAEAERDDDTRPLPRVGLLVGWCGVPETGDPGGSTGG